jgi:hypothetical protein
MIKGIIAIILAFFLLKYREQVVSFTGKFAFAEKYLGQGGTYRLMVILAVLVFIWGVASMTGTTDVFLSPLTFFLNAGRIPQKGGEFDF